MHETEQNIHTKLVTKAAGVLIIPILSSYPKLNYKINYEISQGGDGGYATLFNKDRQYGNYNNYCP